MSSRPTSNKTLMSTARLNSGLHKSKEDLKEKTVRFRKCVEENGINGKLSKRELDYIRSYLTLGLFEGGKLLDERRDRVRAIFLAAKLPDPNRLMYFLDGLLRLLHERDRWFGELKRREELEKKHGKGKKIDGRKMGVW